MINLYFSFDQFCEDQEDTLNYDDRFDADLDTVIDDDYENEEEEEEEEVCDEDDDGIGF